MKLLLDEDSQGRVFVRFLRNASHDVETVGEAGLTSQSDAAVFAYAQQTGRVLLTRNIRDFLSLHDTDRDHPGILAEHQDADSSKNMSYAQVVAAIGKIEASGWDFQGEFVSLNGWR